MCVFFLGWFLKKIQEHYYSSQPQRSSRNCADRRLRESCGGGEGIQLQLTELAAGWWKIKGGTEHFRDFFRDFWTFTENKPEMITDQSEVALYVWIVWCHHWPHHGVEKVIAAIDSLTGVYKPTYKIEGATW